MSAPGRRAMIERPGKDLCQRRSKIASLSGAKMHQ